MEQILYSIEYCFSPERRTLLDTQIYIPGRYWNKKLTKISNELPLVYGNEKDLMKD
jgi:hypothetical protein